MYVTSIWVAHAYNLCENCVHEVCVHSVLSQDSRHYFEHGKDQGFIGWIRLIDERKIKRFIELVESMECDKCRDKSGEPEPKTKP